MRTYSSLPAGRRAAKRSARKRGYTNIETGLEGRLRAKLSSLIRVISEIRGYNSLEIRASRKDWEGL